MNRTSSAATRQARKDLARLEQQIARLDQRLATLHEQMAAAASDYQRLAELQREMELISCQQGRAGASPGWRRPRSPARAAEFAALRAVLMLVAMETASAAARRALGDAVRTDPVTCENYRFDWSRDPTAGVSRWRWSGPSTPQRSRPQSDGQPSTAYRWCRAAPAVASPADPRRFPEASC